MSVDTILVSYTIGEKGVPLLVVGRKGKGMQADIIHALQGNEATELYEKLIGKEEKKGAK